jgi:hypothetical protein
LAKKAERRGTHLAMLLMMGHNVWMHINAVQEANRQYDAGVITSYVSSRKFDRVFFKDIVECYLLLPAIGELLMQ